MSDKIQISVPYVPWRECKHGVPKTDDCKDCDKKCPTCGNPDKGFIECLDPYHPVREVGIEQ